MTVAEIEAKLARKYAALAILRKNTPLYDGILEEIRELEAALAANYGEEGEVY